MPFSATRVAYNHLMKRATESINHFIEKKWLPAVGSEIVKRVGGNARVDFKRGYVVMVTTGRSDVVEVIGIRVSVSYRTGESTMTLHHVVDGEASDVDSLEYGSFVKMKPQAVAEWAVDQTKGRAQTDLPFSTAERDKRNRERARAIVKQEGKDLPYRKRQKRIQEVFEELQSGRRVASV